MSKRLLAAYAASRLLERDPQAIERATLGLRTLMKAVSLDGGSRASSMHSMHAPRVLKSDSGGVNSDLQQKFDRLEVMYKALRNGPTLEKRRALAPAFFRFVAEVESAMYDDARRNGEDLNSATLRISEHTRLNVLTLRDALGWNSDETWSAFMKADPRVWDDV